MKKIFPLLLICVAAVAVWYFSPFRDRPSPSTSIANKQPAESSHPGKDGDRSQHGSSGTQGSNTGTAISPDEINHSSGANSSNGGAADDRSAAEVYKSAEDAIEAVKKASSTYDDIVLQQFTEPGEDCTWCDKFYGSLKDLLKQPATTADQRSYYAELLAISGKKENVSALIDLIKNSPTVDEADIYSEALELSIGKDDIIPALAAEFKSTNESLKEASIAAVTNQGSRLAVETLYQSTVDGGDPDGYYSIGLGLGELVPDEEAFPFLQGAVNKRDQYSHLAVKSLLNAGLPGVKLVVESLSNSRNADFDKQMLKDAVDHVSYDEETAAYINDVAKNAKDPAVVTFAQEILADFKNEENESKDVTDSANPEDQGPDESVE